MSLLRNAACTGATITDVATTQLSQINRGTTLVTVTVGANGVNLPAIYAACVVSQDPVACTAALNDAATYLNSGQIPGQLGDLITTIGARSPHATIVVTGYPVPFVPGYSPVTDNVNQLVELLNTQLGLTALTAGAHVRWAPVEFGDIASAERSHGSVRTPPTRSRSFTPRRRDTSPIATPCSSPSSERGRIASCAVTNWLQPMWMP